MRMSPQSDYQYLCRELCAHSTNQPLHRFGMLNVEAMGVVPIRPVVNVSVAIEFEICKLIAYKFEKKKVSYLRQRQLQRFLSFS